MPYLSIQRKVRKQKTKTNLMPASDLEFPQSTSFKPDPVSKKPASPSQTHVRLDPKHLMTAIKQKHKGFEHPFTMTILNKQVSLPTYFLPCLSQIFHKSTHAL